MILDVWKTWKIFVKRDQVRTKERTKSKTVKGGLRLNSKVVPNRGMYRLRCLLPLILCLWVNRRVTTSTYIVILRKNSLSCRVRLGLPSQRRCFMKVYETGDLKELIITKSVHTPQSTRCLTKVHRFIDNWEDESKFFFTHTQIRTIHEYII